MAHVILGLLLLQPMSLYDLVRAFEAGVSLFYAASTGSIKRSLDSLAERGLIVADEVRPGTRGRKVYRVTPEGQAAFDEWIRGAVGEADGERGVLSRLFFLGLVPRQERAQVAERLEARVVQDLTELQALDEALEEQPVAPGHVEVARYQRLTLAYGIAAHQHGLSWLRTHLRG